MKMVLNSSFVWSVDLFYVQDDVPVRNLIKLSHLSDHQTVLDRPVDGELYPDGPVQEGQTPQEW